MLFLRLKQAQACLKDERLDEAFDLLKARDIQAHYQGQKLIGKLIEAYISRGRVHLEAGRFAQASMDCDKAMRLGGNRPGIMQLNMDITEATQQYNRRKYAQAGMLAEADEHIKNGRLSMGEKALADTTRTHEHAVKLRQNVAQKRTMAEKALANARSAIARRDWEIAVKELSLLRKLHPTDQHLPDLLKQVSDELISSAQSTFNNGRIDQAEFFLGMLAPLKINDVRFDDLNKVVAHTRSAANCLNEGRFRKAAEYLRLVRIAHPDTNWIAPAIDHARQAAEKLDSLRGGPLGLLADKDDPPQALPESQVEPALPYTGRKGNAGVQTLASENVQEDFPGRLIMHVDGAGSFFIVRKESVTVGPSGVSEDIDIGLLTDRNSPALRIEREQGDYLLSCDQRIPINDTPVNQKLLADNDRVVLSPRCRLKFNLPNPASSSALLDLRGARLPNVDARKVILMDKEIVMSDDSKGHIRIPGLQRAVLLFERNGCFYCQNATDISIDGRPVDARDGIPLDVNVKIDGVSLVIRSA